MISAFYTEPTHNCVLNIEFIKIKIIYFLFIKNPLFIYFICKNLSYNHFNKIHFLKNQN